jgi:hypothetical protein
MRNGSLLPNRVCFEIESLRGKLSALAAIVLGALSWPWLDVASCEFLGFIEFAWGCMAF